MAKIVQTAGRDNLGDFAPQFAHFNDDVLFGEEWNNEDITAKTRSIITISVFMGRGLVDSSLKAHLQIGRKNGITKKEITALITHAAFYAGWPVAWAVFNMAKEIWADDSGEADNRTPELNEYAKTIFFPVGEPNDAYAQYFDGNSYLAPIEAEGVAISNVTFEPGCRNHWHIHRASQGGGQMLIAVGGRGYYQLEGQEPVEMLPGDTVFIPPNTRHWHGASPNSWFSHLAFMVPGRDTGNEWLEPVDEEEYNSLA